jgi:RNA polymerase sigma factor (sigma-70 family)
MSAVHAIDLRSKVKELPVRTSRKQIAPKQKAKVIKLPIRRKKLRQLTDFERENVVLEHRPKARKLARSILRRWHARLDLEEVDSVVDLSLCEAIRRFNPNKGASFMTFLYYHLRGNLIRAVSSAANANSIPLPDFENAEAGAAQNEGQHASGRGTSASEVAEALCSAEQPLPDEVLFRKEVSNLSHQACEKLDVLEKEVISGVYLEERQLMEVAKSLGYSRCHISRVKRKALEVLFNELKVSGEGVLPFIAPKNKVRPALKLAARRAALRRRVHTSMRRNLNEKAGLLQAAS